MRIAVVSAHYPPNFVSGGTLVPQRIARALHEGGHDVRVFAGHLDPSRAPLSTWQETDPVGLPVHWVTTAPWIGWSDRHNYHNPEVTEVFRAWLRSFRPDIVHFHSLQSLGAGVVDAACDDGARTVVTLHDFWWWCARQFLVTRDWHPCSIVVDAGACECETDRVWLNQRNAYLRRILGRVDLVLAVSTSMARVALANGVDPDRLAVNENGLPGDTSSPNEPPDPGSARVEDRPRGGREGPVRFVYAGGPHEMKGIHILADAARRLSELPGWTLACFGCADWLKARAPELLEDRVTAPPPYRPEQREEVLAAADVLVIPSVMRESYSLLAREALAHGVPVVTTDCLGPEEVVDHGENGLVVPAADPAVLADALETMVRDPELRNRLRGRTASGRVHPLSEQLRELSEHYDYLLSSHRTPRTVHDHPGRRREVRRVLIIAGIEGAPLRYRAWLPAEALHQRGVSADVRHYRHPEVSMLAEQADAVVIYRVPGTVQVAHLISGIRRRRVPVVFDVDDLIFDPELQHEIPAIKILPADEAALWLEGVHRYRSTMEMCDAFVGSTPMLCQHATAVTGLPSYLFENGVGLVLARLSDEAIGTRRRPGRIRIGYLSGTTTHERDWAHVEPAIAEILAAYRDVELWLVGWVQPSRRLQPFADRVRHLPFVTWTDLPKILRDLDVNLAPLEPETRFNEAKSAVKWLEAALVATPTVASPTEPFARVIRPGENGLLATDHHEWVHNVKALLDSPELRSRLGHMARRDALLEFAPAVQGRRYLDILEEVDLRPTERSTWTPRLHDESFEPLEFEPYVSPCGPQADAAGTDAEGSGRRRRGRLRAALVNRFGRTRSSS